MAKALESDANAVILDLEDSVPISAKAEARALVAKAIDSAAVLPAASRIDAAPMPLKAIFMALARSFRRRAGEETRS